MTETRQATPLGVPDSSELKFLPEGPYALGESLISWVGIQHGLEATVGSVNRYDLEQESNESFELPGRPGFAFPCARGNKFVVGCERSLGFYNITDRSWTPFCDGIDQDVENTIINDGLVYEDNLVFGTKDLEFATPKAGLYLWRGSDQQLIRLRNDQICSNGKAIRQTDAGLELIDIDSPTRQVVAYPLDIQAGTLGDRRVLLDLTEDPAVPDGAVLTPDGSSIIVAMFLPQAADHGETRMYDLATGDCKVIWQTAGSPQNTCPALVHHEGSLKLIITTAVEHMDEATQQACPNAGQLFWGEIDVVDDGSEFAPAFPN